MNELRCSLCDVPTRLGCNCARLVIGSHMERDQAVVRMGRELARQRAIEKFDFRALVPSEDELPEADPAVERARITLARGTRLAESGIDKAITDEDFVRLTQAWKIHVDRSGKRWILPVIRGRSLKVAGQAEFEHDTEALRNVVKWEHARSTNTSAFGVVVLLGLRGRGKTVAGGWLIAGRGPGLYTTAEQLRASYAADHYRERALYLRALKARVLFVDELGREKDAETADGMLFDLVNNRRGSGRGGRFWTVFAGNLSDADFRARYDPSTVERIEQLGTVFTCEGENLRGRLVDELGKQKVAKQGGG
jgi:hypothetical protein